MRDRPKAGTITHCIEIPVTVSYTYYPAEPMTYHDPGCPAWVEYNCKIPDIYKILDILKDDDDGIEEACFRDAEND
ncbi:MAG: hypothetical protein ABIK92_17830 [Pseudomonadota bacterium]